MPENRADFPPSLRLVPPPPDAASRPSRRVPTLRQIALDLWCVFNRWIDRHLRYEEIERDRMDYVLRGWCGDCDDRVTIVTHNGREHCIRCAGTAVDEVGVVWMEREDGGS